MPRRMKRRRIGWTSNVEMFKPAGMPMAGANPIELMPDEMEAIRLKDYKGLDQQAAAEAMGISQPTFHRIYISARQKIATALIEGRALFIRKGDTF